MLIGILEDNCDIAEMYKLAMEMEGYEALAFGEVLTFVNTVAQHRPRQYDALICDMDLGTGMSGADAIKAIRVIIPGMPAIIISGSNHTELAKAQAALPDVTVFRKPAPILAILSKIEYLTHNTRLPNTEEIKPLWFAHLTDP